MDTVDQKLWEFHETQNRQAFLLGRPRLDYLSARLPKADKDIKVLDIGIGDGYLLEKLGNRFTAFGIDLSESNVQQTSAQLRQKNIEAMIKAASIDNIPFDDQMFDYVIASDVLEHLEETTLRNGLKEIQRVLKKGGDFIGTVPADENLQDNLCYCPKCGYAFHRWGHYQTFSRNRIKEIFSGRDFEIKRIERVTFFGQLLSKEDVLMKIKFYIARTLFLFLKRIFAPQWWFYFQVTKARG